MKISRHLLFFAILIFLIASGCASAGNSPAFTEIGPSLVSNRNASHQSWGLYQFQLDKKAGAFVIIPLRNANIHLNALPYLEPPALTLLTVESLDVSGSQVTADIGLRHPFFGQTRFTGFDVCGIFISSGSVTGFDDTDLRMPGDGDTRLLNPDGYTRWWNPHEFPVNNGTIFGYTDGLLGNEYWQENFNCTLNGYKYYSDNLGVDDELYGIEPADRGVFSAGQKNVRRFEIQMDAGLVFNYAIDACWQQPVGDPPYTAPGSFGPAANRPEAWNINVTETGNTLWNDGETSGGNLNLSIDVYDHFNADSNLVRVESPGNCFMITTSLPNGSGPGYSTYEINIDGATPSPDSIDLLITIESDKSGYNGLLPGKPISAYFVHTSDVASGNPLTGVFVDGDNPGDPDECGTEAHPFDTIQEGIDAAGTGAYIDIYDVYVDPYEGGNYSTFILKDNVQLHGEPWNEGSGRPGVILTGEWTPADGVSNSMIENFIFNLNHTAQVSGMVNMINIISSPYFTLKDCMMTGIISAQYSVTLHLEFSDNFTVEHNEFVNIRNRSTHSPGTHRYYILWATDCDDGLVIHNEMHDIGYDDEGDATTSNYTAGYLMFFHHESGDHCENLQVINNLFYDINDYSKSSGTAKNWFHVFGWGDETGYESLPGLIYANNTADDISVIGDDTSVSGNASLTWGRLIDDVAILKNSIASNFSPITTAGDDNYHRGFWAESGASIVPVTYSCCYNFGTPGSGVTVDGYFEYFSKGTGSFDLDDNYDPAYDMTPGANFYHVTNTALKSDDNSEMGAFGGPYGNWTPPSQE